MKVKRMLIFTLLISMLGFSTAFASDTLFNGYQTIRVFLNNQEMDQSSWDVPSFIIDGRAVLPMRKISTLMQGIIKWDEDAKTANIYKPNVNMMLGESYSSDDYTIKHFFAKVPVDQRISFFAVVQVDSLKIPVKYLRMTVLNPDGLIAKQTKDTEVNVTSSNFQYVYHFQDMVFKTPGKYILKFELKTDDQSDYVTVAQKAIISE